MPHSQETISCALAPTNANLDHEVMVTGIKVSYKKPRKDYPVSVRIIIGDEVTIKSQRYDKTKQEFLWDLNNCPRQFSSDATFTVVVREHHSIQRWDGRVSTTVTVANMIMKPILVIDEPSGEAMSLSIHCETAGPFVDLIHQLVEDAQGRLLEMKPFIEQLGKVCEALNIIVIVSKPLGDAHPGVKAAVKVATLLYEKCNAMQACHAAATELMEDIASFLPFTEIPTESCKSTVTVQTSESLLEVFEQISRAIIDTSPATVLGFLLIRDRRNEVNGYKEKLKKLKDTFDWCIKTEIWKTVLNIETHTANLLLTRLRPVDSAFYASEKSCFEGTRKDTLDIIERWSSSDSNIFWLYGSEGCGKSTIAHTVAQLFDEQNRLAGCFFFDGCGVERRNPEAVIPTIAYQLAKWHKPYFRPILDLLSGHAERNIHSSLVSQFNLLIRKPLIELSEQSMAKHQPPPHRSLIIVLDALEQCCKSGNSRSNLVEYIRDMAGLVPWLKVFISSKKLPEFNVILGTDCQELDISDPLIDFEHDMVTYTKYYANGETLDAARRRTLYYKAPGVFSRMKCLSRRLNALLVGNNLAENAVQVEQPGMDELFHISTAAIMSLWRYADMVPITRNVLAVVAFVTATGGKPPTQGILLQLLSPFWPEITSDALSDVLRSLRPILSFNGFKVELLFPASQFLCLLSDGRRSGSFAVDINEVGNRVAQRCFDEMDAHLDSSYLLSKDADNLAALIKMRIPEVLYYSCLNWMDCVIKSGDAQAFSKSVFSFLCSPRILVWLEVLSLTGRQEVSKEILLKCIDFFKDHNDICETAKELYGFISGNYTAMELSTSHVYVFALAWLPRDSLLSNRVLRFASSRPRIVFESSETKETAKGMDSEDFFRSFACSIDGSRVVSGHKDGRLNIWDGRTGVLIHGPLSGHSDGVWFVAFSPDGSRIASSSFDGLRIWDALIGKLVTGPFKTESCVTAVTFSPDESRFVSGHKDGRIRNALSGDVIVESWGCHEEWVQAAAYSPDGNRIVTGSDDETLRIWDANTAASIGNPLVGHRNSVMAVAYSPDCSKIVSGSDDETVRIWDAQSGRQLGEPLEGRVQDVGFSRDGSRILSSSVDEIRMWDAYNRAPVGDVPRGESRWDIEWQCFVSVPSWWPSGQELKVQSFLLSANPLYIPDDGWIRTLDGDLLLWVPPEHRGCACHTTRGSTVTKDEHDERILNSEWRKLFHGKDWARIMGIEGTEDE